MNVYLAGPNTQQQAEHLEDMDVLLSFAYKSDWVKQYYPSFGQILIDSGAYSELNSGRKIDIEEYRDWSEQWVGTASAIAGLDDIRGDYKKGLRNLQQIPWSFPTWHDTDPWELIPDLVAIAKERKTWIGIGLLPPRENKERIIRDFCDAVPNDIHIHGWALRAYTNVRRLDSIDSTNWWRDAMRFRRDMPWLHYGDALDLVVKRYKREARFLSQVGRESTDMGGQMVLPSEDGLVGSKTVLDTNRPNSEGAGVEAN